MLILRMVCYQYLFLKKSRHSLKNILLRLRKILNVNDSMYIVLGTVSVETGYTTDELKNMWKLADTVLRNGNEYYVCNKVIEAEFKDLK